MEIPPALDTPEFKKAWADWLAYRKQRRLAKYKTNRVLINLARYGVEVAILAIESSLNNEWQGLFPEKHGREQVPRDARLGRAIYRGGRSIASADKYSHLDEGTSPPTLPFVAREAS